MINKLSKLELSKIANIVKEKIFIPRSQNKTSIFLCGADKNNSKTGRSKMDFILSKYARHEILYPEDLFDDLLAGQGKYSLLSLENILADSVDVILLFPESPGSFAELGAFSNNERLAKKLICISQKKYKSEKSFINYGPYRLIRNSKSGKVLHINYAELSEEETAKKIYRKVNSHISAIKKLHPVEKNETNILEAENFILPCIYLVSSVELLDLYHLLESVSGADSSLCEIAVKSALSRLTARRLITKESSGYKVTKTGVAYIHQAFFLKYLDSARIEVLNVENRTNASINYDRMSNAYL